MRVLSMCVLLCVFLVVLCVVPVLCVSPLGPSWYFPGPPPSGSLFVKQPSTPSSNQNGVTLKDFSWPIANVPATTDCSVFLDSGQNDCCIGTHTVDAANWFPDNKYGFCSNSDEHNCPGGIKAGCTAGLNSGGGSSCPASLTVGDTTVYPKCRLASDFCATTSQHCWGTLECYANQNPSVTDPTVSCGPGGTFVYQSGKTVQVYQQGSFCFETGSADNDKWCPGCPPGSSLVDNVCICDILAQTLVDGVCQCPNGEVLNPLSGICCPSTNPTCRGGSPLAGDPQIGGFQGQSYQFHGLPDEVFNLISTPTLQVNGHFVYLSSGKCDYNDTECWSHPGTYIDQLGFSFGSHRVKIVAGTHTVGLRVDIDGDRISNGNYKLYANGTDVHIKYHQHGQVHIKTHEFVFTVYNSDMFFNMETSLLDHNLLRIGAPKHSITDSTLCKKEDSIDHSTFQASLIKHQHNHGAVEAAIEKKYGGVQVPLHGLIGQTWRNVLVCNKHWVGTVTDYVCSNLFASDYFFNFYHQD